MCGGRIIALSRADKLMVMLCIQLFCCSVSVLYADIGSKSGHVFVCVCVLSGGGGYGRYNRKI